MGAYVFELLGCLEFEWQVLTRKRAFKAPMLVRPPLLPASSTQGWLPRPPRELTLCVASQLYFYCKWALLAALTGM